MISGKEPYNDVDESSKTNVRRSTSNHLHCLSTVVYFIQQKEGGVYDVVISSPNGEHILAQALSKAVHCCTEVGQHQTGLYMVQQAASSVKASSALIYSSLIDPDVAKWKYYMKLLHMHHPWST